MNPAALLSRLSALGAASDADAFLIGAAAAGLLVVAGLAAAAYRRERRPSEARDDRRRGDEEAARRLRETEELRLRLVGLERKLEEAAQALAARAALDAAGPAPASAAPAGAAPAPAAAGADAPPARALVCVPDATVARVFESLLKPCGYETDRCADGIDAAALAARRGPAAAVLDLDALGADAPAIVRAVRARLAKPGRLLVVACDEASALRAGAERSEVLLRPLDFLEAVRRVRGGAVQEARR